MTQAPASLLRSHLADRFDVTGLPALVLFKNGRLAGRLVGFHSRTQLAAALAPHPVEASTPNVTEPGA